MEDPLSWYDERVHLFAGNPGFSRDRSFLVCLFLSEGAPWNLLVHFFQPFTAGLHRLKNLWIYVNRGTGYWGPPHRFGVPSEITRIRLVPAAP
jgi:hypothetical protein